MEWVWSGPRLVIKSIEGREAFNQQPEQPHTLSNRESSISSHLPGSASDLASSPPAPLNATVVDEESCICGLSPYPYGQNWRVHRQTPKLIMSIGIPESGKHIDPQPLSQCSHGWEGVDTSCWKSGKGQQ